MTAAYDSNNQAVEMTHDVDNRRETVKNARGYKTTYTYDDEGNITDIVDAKGGRTQIQYDALGNEKRTVNALNQATVRSFDPKSGKQLSETDALNHTNSWTYDGADLKSATDARNNTTQYTFADDGSLSVAEPLGRSSKISFDPNGNLSSLSVAGQTSTFTYDARGNKQSETDAAGNVTTFTYDANNRELSRTVKSVTGKNAVTSTKYDANGRVIADIDTQGRTTQSVYDAGGLLKTRIDQQGRATNYEYDGNGRLSKTAYPDNSSETIRYDAQGNVIANVDRQGRETRMDYDELDRLVKTTYPDGSVVQTEYDAAGREIGSTDARGQKSVQRWDDAGRLIESEDALKHAVAYAYDENGNRIKTTDATRQVTQYRYDELNRLKETVLQDQSVISNEWRPDGRKQAEIDSARRRTAFDWDALGQLKGVTQSDGAQNLLTQYRWKVSNKTEQTDAENRTTRWRYDDNNRIAARVLPLGQTESFEYDDAGNVQKKTDFSRQTTTYGYDAAGRVQLVTRSDGVTIMTTWKTSGVPESITVAGNGAAGMQLGKTTFEYDAMDRMIRQTNPDGRFLAWKYDGSGNIEERSTGEGTVRYRYDGANRLTDVTDIDGRSTTHYEWSVNNQIQSRTTPNGVSTAWTYDTVGRLRQIVHQKNNQILTGMAYVLDASGLRIEAHELDKQSTPGMGDAQGNFTMPANAARVTQYQYDGVKRLTQEKILERGSATPWRTVAWQYDKVGNRKLQTTTTAAGVESIAYVYDENDRLKEETLTAIGGGKVTTAYLWDDSGNLKARTAPGQITLYAWNAENKLIEVRQGKDAASATAIAQFRYDAKGNRVQKIEPAKTTDYLTDDTFAYAQVVQETTKEGTQTESTRVVWGASLIQQVRGGQGIYYAEDGLNSIKALMDGNGNVTDQYRYDAFGAVQSQTGNSRNNYRFAGEFVDDTIALSYNRARFLDLNVGRFVSRDKFSGFPIRPITINKYLYGNANAINEHDPSGRLSLSEVGTAAIVTGVLIGISLRNSANRPVVGQPEADMPGRPNNTIIGLIVLASMSNQMEKISRQVLEKRKNKDPLVTLFRAVEDEELADIYSCNCFRLSRNGFPKQFFGSGGEATIYGERALATFKTTEHIHLVSGTISETLYKALDFSAYEPGIGPIITVQNGLLGALNYEVNLNGGIKYQRMIK